MYRIVALCLPLITLAWPSVRRQCSRQKNFAVNIQQWGREGTCAVSFFLLIQEKAVCSPGGLYFNVSYSWIPFCLQLSCVWVWDGNECPVCQSYVPPCGQRAVDVLHLLHSMRLCHYGRGRYEGSCQQQAHRWWSLSPSCSDLSPLLFRCNLHTSH